MAEDPDGYGSKQYWEDRYEINEKGPTFEWYMSWAELKDDLLAALAAGHDGHNEAARVQRDAPLLMVGCGNSPMSADMCADGFTRIISCDYSEVVIKQMRTRFPHLQYDEADVRCMPQYANGAFPYVIDKGTLDAILCGADSAANAAAMLQELDRVLAPGGVFVLITYGEPSTRLCYLTAVAGWRVHHRIVGETRNLYTCVKSASASASALVSTSVAAVSTSLATMTVSPPAHGRVESSAPANMCASCWEVSGLETRAAWRCNECTPPALYCGECDKARHVSRGTRGHQRAPHA